MVESVSHPAFLTVISRDVCARTSPPKTTADSCHHGDRGEFSNGRNALTSMFVRTSGRSSKTWILIVDEEVRSAEERLTPGLLVFSQVSNQIFLLNPRQ